MLSFSSGRFTSATSRTSASSATSATFNCFPWTPVTVAFPAFTVLLYSIRSSGGLPWYFSMHLVNRHAWLWVVKWILIFAWVRDSADAFSPNCSNGKRWSHYLLMGCMSRPVGPADLATSWLAASVIRVRNGSKYVNLIGKGNKLHGLHKWFATHSTHSLHSLTPLTHFHPRSLPRVIREAKVGSSI